MQAVILAAGQSSRFFPFGGSGHKSLISILGKPVITHTIEAVIRSGIKDIIIVISKDSRIKEILGDGTKFGARITYVIQEKPTGAGNGLLLCRKYIKGNFFLLNASRIDFDNFKKPLEAKLVESKAVLLGRKQKGPAKYGFLKTQEDKVLDLLEKPGVGNQPSDIRVVGVYLFTKNFLETLEDTPGEHYSLESAISKFSKNNLVKFVQVKDKAPSLKYAWDLLELKNYLLARIKTKISKNAKISKSSEISGEVIVEDGARIMEGAKIKGPSYIGKNSMVGTNALVRDGSCVEENSETGANAEIKNTLIMKNTKIHSGFIGDSVVGENVRIGAGFKTANKRIDRKEISVLSPDQKKIETGLNSLGAIIGNDVKIGINSSSMPGVIIGSNSLVGPSTTVLKNVPPDTKYYTKFQEIVEKK